MSANLGRWSVAIRKKYSNYTCFYIINICIKTGYLQNDDCMSVIREKEKH